MCVSLSVCVCAHTCVCDEDRVNRPAPDLSGGRHRRGTRLAAHVLQDPDDDDDDDEAALTLLHRHGCAGRFWIRMGLLRERSDWEDWEDHSLHLHRAAGVNGSVCAAAAARPAGKHPDHAGGVATPTNEKHHLPVPEQHGPIRRAHSAADASGSLQGVSLKPRSSLAVLGVITYCNNNYSKGLLCMQCN